MAQQSFLHTLETIEYKVQTELFISRLWFADMEQKNNVLISIEDNGFLLNLPFSEQTSHRNNLIQEAKKHALEQGIDSSIYPISFDKKNKTDVFTLKDENGRVYYGCISILVSTDNWQNIIFLQDVTNLHKSIWSKILVYLFVDLIGIILLGIIIWRITGKILVPLEENHQKQKEFIAAASHELRSPLSVIRAIVSSLPSSIEVNANSDLQTAWNDIDTESVRMAKLIDELLSLASTDAKAWTIKLAPVHVDTLLIDIFEMYINLAHEKEITLTLNLPEESLPQIQADKERLRQVITILLDNAISYTPNSGTITISASSKKRHLLIQIADTGIGIPQDNLGDIFHRFYRVDASRNENNHFGLGLSIAKELVDLHGGKICCESIPNKGTIFSVWLD